MPTYQVWLTATEAGKLGEIASAEGKTSEELIQEFIRWKLKRAGSVSDIEGEIQLPLPAQRDRFPTLEDWGAVLGRLGDVEQEQRQLVKDRDAMQKRLDLQHTKILDLTREKPE